MRDLAAPRVPATALKAALYESHYLTAVDPAGGRAVWLRHTALKRPGQPARPTVWLTGFDRRSPAPVSFRVTASETLADPSPGWARSALGSFGPGWARGAIEGATWDLGWASEPPELPYLPARWLYDRRVPRSGGVALTPHTAVSGRVTVPIGESKAKVELEEWDGMIGHNWGSEHAEQWAWLHAGGFGEGGADWCDFVLARVRIGRWLTPWIASGALCVDGRRRGPDRRGRAELRRDGERTLATIPMADGPLTLELTAPAPATVHWDYASPTGTSREVDHCSVADGVIGLGRRRWELSARVSVEHGRPAPAG